MTAEVIYIGALRNRAVHVQSGTEIRIDAPKDNQGLGEAFSPTDLVATALAACMLTIMGIAAAGRGWDIDGTRASVLKVMASAPRRIERIELRIEFPDSARSLSEEAKELLERAARTCPVALSLHPDLVQAIEFVWGA